MSAAVPLVQDDQFWLDNPSCRLVRSECEVYLDERAIISEHAVDSDSEPSVSVRGARRRTKRFRIRGSRPTDPIELRSTRWFARVKKTPAKHSRYKFTQLVLVPDLNGTLVTDVKRACPKPAPNYRKNFVPGIEPDRRAVDPVVTIVDTATTEVSDDDELVEGEVVLECCAKTVTPLARVIVPLEAITSEADSDEPDLDFSAMLGDDPASGEVLELPMGFHVEDGGGSFNHRSERERLVRAAQTEPDWGDPEDWDFGRHEPTYLQIRT
jgi:hypothetical protein